MGDRGRERGGGGGGGTKCFSLQPSFLLFGVVQPVIPVLRDKTQENGKIPPHSTAFG